MEIGPLSEWVGALAEFIAVTVALFLPYYTARKTAGNGYAATNTSSINL